MASRRITVQTFLRKSRTGGACPSPSAIYLVTGIRSGNGCLSTGRTLAHPLSVRLQTYLSHATDGGMLAIGFLR